MLYVSKRTSATSSVMKTTRNRDNNFVMGRLLILYLKNYKKKHCKSSDKVSYAKKVCVLICRKYDVSVRTNIILVAFLKRSFEKLKIKLYLFIIFN